MASTPPKSSSNSISSPESIVFDIDTTLDQFEDPTAATSESADKHELQESSSGKKAKPPKTYLNLSLPQPIGEAEVLACLEKIQNEGGWEKTMLHGKKIFFSTNSIQSCTNNDVANSISKFVVDFNFTSIIIYSN